MTQQNLAELHIVQAENYKCFIHKNNLDYWKLWYILRISQQQ